MTVSEAWAKRYEAERLEDEVRRAFPCEECDGVGEHYPGHHWDPCLECNGTGINTPDEDDEEDDDGT